MDFRTVSVEELARQVRRRELSAREVVSHALEGIDALNGELNAFVAVDDARALADAARVDDALDAGDDVGPLAGVPLAVKDLEDAAGYRTSHGSAAHAGDPPAKADSVLVARLKAAGAVVVGKTNTPELGWKADTHNVTFGATRNPWATERSPGGSSGGSAAALAAGLVPLATGSDGGGSIRIPSAICGLSGFKPTLGRVPHGEAEPPGWLSLSTRGPMARRVRDIALALDVAVGPHPVDRRSLPAPDDGPWRPRLDTGAPVRVGWSPDLGYAPVDDEVAKLCREAVGLLDDAGCEVVEIDPVLPEDPVMTWVALTSAYNLRSLLPYEGTAAWEQMDPGLRQSVEWGRELSAVDLVAAEDDAHRIGWKVAEAFAAVDLIVTPTTAGLPPLSGDLAGTVNGEPELNWVRFTYPFNLTGSPAGSVCAGLTRDGLPVGLQVVGPRMADCLVLQVMATLEDRIAFDSWPPLGRADR